MTLAELCQARSNTSASWQARGGLLVEASVGCSARASEASEAGCVCHMIVRYELSRRLGAAL